MNEFAEWWADEVAGNGVRWDEPPPLPDEFRTSVAIVLQRDHGWPDYDSARAYVDELYPPAC